MTSMYILRTDEQRPTTDRPTLHFGNGSSDPLRLILQQSFQGRRIEWSNGATSGWSKSKTVSSRHLGNFRMAIQCISEWVIGLPVYSTVGSSGRRIKCLYFRLDQIQDCSCQPSCITLNGHISKTVHTIQSVFGSRVKVQEKIMLEQ